MKYKRATGLPQDCPSAAIRRFSSLSRNLVCKTSALAFLAMATVVHSETREFEKVQNDITELRQKCVAMGGAFDATHAVTSLDLDGGGNYELIFEPAKTTCMGQKDTMWCGSGGCWMYLVTQHSTIEILAYEWSVAILGKSKVLLTHIRGDACGPEPWAFCVRAYTVYEDKVYQLVE